MRVIGFFDALVEQGADIDLILRQTAALTECPVGVRSSSGQLCERLEPGGEVRFAGPPPGARRYQLPSGDQVWLERDEGEHPLDDLVLERLALAAAVALGRGHQDLDTLDHSALLRLAVDATTPDSARRRVLERLGIRPASTVHVLAMAGPADQLDELGRQLPGKYRARLGEIKLLLAAHPPQDTLAVPRLPGWDRPAAPGRGAAAGVAAGLHRAAVHPAEHPPGAPVPAV